jgi:hypothetical protein
MYLKENKLKLETKIKLKISKLSNLIAFNKELEKQLENK